MALEHFGFIVSGRGLHPDEHVALMRSDSFTMTAVGVSDVEQACSAARRLVADGVQLIELCGGFGPVGTAAVLAAIDQAVPVGSVAYGPESIDAMQRLFASSGPAD